MVQEQFVVKADQIKLRTFLKFRGVDQEKFLVVFGVLGIHFEVGLFKLAECKRGFFDFCN